MTYDATLHYSSNLNGAILAMEKAEHDRKFADVVACMRAPGLTDPRPAVGTVEG